MGRRAIDLKGKVFGRLTVLNREENNHKGAVMWRCECECGTVVVRRGDMLRNGHTRSCNCMLGDVLRTHGMHKSREYVSWSSAKQRCTNPKKDNYDRYGGRGITMCSRWLTSFENFYKDMGDRPEGMTLDRKDNDGDYELSNCRWATGSDQNNNRDNTIYIEHEGKLLCLNDWATLTGINRNTLWSRIARGLTSSEILTPITKS